MKETKVTKVKSSAEEALYMYGEDISLSKDAFISILNQIPEKEQNKQTNPMIKSPYKWVAFLQISTLCLMAIVFFPTFKDMYIYSNEPFYFVDKQIAEFESSLDDSDNIMLYYNNNL